MGNYTRDSEKMGAPGLAHGGPSLIGPNDPPPVSIINEQGTGRLLLVGDHVSNTIPAAMDNLGLEEMILQQHVAYDIGTRQVLHYLSQQLNAPAVLAGYSRLLVDLNRSPEDPTLIPEQSDTVAIPGNQGLTREEKAQRVHSFYLPYRAAIDRHLLHFRRRGIVPAFICIHSFTPEMAGQTRPWQIGLMWDKDPRIALPLLKSLRAHPNGIIVGDNLPYSGKHQADYTIDHHAESTGLPHIAIEIRQDLIATEEKAVQWGRILSESLRDILADPTLYQVWEG